MDLPFPLKTGTYLKQVGRRVDRGKQNRQANKMKKSQLHQHCPECCALSLEGEVSRGTQPYHVGAAGEWSSLLKMNLLYSCEL